MPTANTIETLADRFACSSPLRCAFTLSSPDLTQPFYSPAYHHQPLLSAKVETVRGWREQAKAERDAGLEGSGEQHQYTILIQFFKCDLCRICIGRDYYEQELYLYPVYHQKERISDDPTYYDEPRFLHICGGCAARRCLPSTLRMIEPAHWLTTVLLVEGSEEEVRDANPESTIEKFRIRKALRERIERYHQYYQPLLLVNALQKGEVVPALPELRREKATRKVGKSQPGSLLYFTNPLATALSLPKSKPVLQEPLPRKENVV